MKQLQSLSTQPKLEAAEPLSLTKSTFSSPRRRDQIQEPTSASILLLARGSRDTCDYALLGQEVCWPRVYKMTGGWGGFGGRINPGESVPDAAVREFLEETMGVLSKDTNDLVRRLVHTCTQKKRKVELKNATCIKVRCNLHVMFVIKLPYRQLSACSHFTAVRHQLRSLQRSGTLDKTIHGLVENHPAVVRKPDGMMRVIPDYLEKRLIQWVTLDSLFAAAQQRPPIIEEIRAPLQVSIHTKAACFARLFANTAPTKHSWREKRATAKDSKVSNNSGNNNPVVVMYTKKNGHRLRTVFAQAVVAYIEHTHPLR